VPKSPSDAPAGSPLAALRASKPAPPSRDLAAVRAEMRERGAAMRAAYWAEKVGGSIYVTDSLAEAFEALGDRRSGGDGFTSPTHDVSRRGEVLERLVLAVAPDETVPLRGHGVGLASFSSVTMSRKAWKALEDLAERSRVAFIAADAASRKSKGRGPRPAGWSPATPTMETAIVLVLRAARAPAFAPAAPASDAPARSRKAPAKDAA